MILNQIVILDSYQPYHTGVDTYICELTNAFKDDLTYSFVRIILDFPSQTLSLATCDNVDIVRLPYLRNDYGLLKCLIISSLIPDNKGICFLINFYPCANLIYNLKKIYKHAQIICVVHDYKWAFYVDGNTKTIEDLSKNKAYLKNSEKSNLKSIMLDGLYAFTNSSKVVCLSKDSYRVMHLIYGVPHSKIAYIPNGMKDRNESYGIVNTNKISKVKNLKRFIFVGRICRSKGADLLINAFLDLCKGYTDIELILAGDISDDFKYKLELQNSRLPNIRWYGHCNHENISELYLSADFGIIPSLYEQSPYVGIEMKCFGLPIIASNVMGLRDMFNNDNSIVCYTTLTSIKDAIRHALSLIAPEIFELKCKSRQDYLNRYSLTSMKNNYSLLFSDCL